MQTEKGMYGSVRMLRWLLVAVISLAAMMLAVAQPVAAQNLVQNPGFEDFSQCPGATGPSWIARAAPWDNPGGGTADLMNTCVPSASPPWSNSPNNTSGCQPPHSGDGYAHIITNGSTGNGTYAEYIQQPLSAPLTQGVIYSVEAWVSRAEAGNLASDGIGLHLSDKQISTTASGQWAQVASVRNPKGHFLSDFDSWELIFGTYQAKGGEQWLTIGSMPGFVLQNDVNTNGCITGYEGATARYFIDDVKVCGPAAVPSFTMNSEYCSAEPIILNGSASTNETGYNIFIYITDKIGSDTPILPGSCDLHGSGPVPSTIDLKALCPANFFDTGGIYKVKLAVFSDCTTWNETVKWISVQPAECCGFSGTVDPPGPVNSCSATTLTGTPISGAPPFQYLWTKQAPNSNLPEFYSDQKVITTNSSGTADYMVEITDANSCKAVADATEVTTATGHASFELPSTLCVNDIAFLDGTNTLGDSYVLDIFEIAHVGSTTSIGGYFTTGTVAGSPGVIELNGPNGIYPYPMDIGKVYRTELRVNGCESSVGVEAKDIVITACGECAAPPAGMVGWWTGDDTAADISGYGNDGSYLQGATASYAPGKVRRAFDIDPANTGLNWEFVRVPDAPSLLPGTGDFSIDAWIRTSGAEPAQGNLRVLDTIEEVAWYAFSVSADDTLELSMSPAGVFNPIVHESDPGINLHDHQWHHVAVTIDRDHPEGVKFYIDGIPAGTRDATLSQGDVSGPPNIGQGRNVHIGGRSEIVVQSQDEFFVQPNSPYLLDEVELFNRALTENEIASIANAGSSGKCLEARCSLAGPLNFCDTEVTETGTLTVCNDTLQQQTYDVNFIGLPGRDGQIGLGCNVDGPTGFAPQTTSITIDPGKCEPVSVAVDAPDNLPATFDLFGNEGATGCYMAQVRNQSTGIWNECTSQVKRMISFCPATPTGGGFGFGNGWVQYGSPVNLAFPLKNQDSNTRQVDYTIVSAGSSGDPQDSLVMLNGQASLTSVSGSVTIQPGETADIPVTVEFDQFNPFDIQNVTLRTDITGDGVSEAVSNVALQMGCPDNSATGPVDADGDGIRDACDNCSGHVNADQRDSDGDGYGNACDADLNDDGFTNSLDVGLFKSVFFSTDADADINGDGIVNSLDLGPLEDLFFQPPGPSGLMP